MPVWLIAILFTGLFVGGLYLEMSERKREK